MNIGLGCGRYGCDCPYCNGDNYDRYMGDHLRDILDEINRHLVCSVHIEDDKIKGNEELYYKVIEDSILKQLREATHTSENSDNTIS